MEILRTPEERFENISGYDFPLKYVSVGDGLEMHYVDEGGADSPVVLLLHGEPSWSYLYRKMIPLLVEKGFRAVAPDLIGFGKSDKPVEKSDYSYESHLNWTLRFIEALDLQKITLFCQDWGGLLGLRLAAEHSERFSGVVASNTALPTGQIPMPESFMKWREFSQNSPEFDIGKVIDMGTVEPLSDDVIAAYNAPFPSEEYKSGARMFPTLVPVAEDETEAKNNKMAWGALMQWEKPFATIFGAQDMIMKGAEQIFQQVIPGAKNQNHDIIDAGHFIQEEKPTELVDFIAQYYHSNN